MYTPCKSKIIEAMLSMLQVIPILRAGLVLLEQAATVLPSTMTYHVGYVRDEKTLKVCVLCRPILPSFRVPHDRDSLIQIVIRGIPKAHSFMHML